MCKGNSKAGPGTGCNTLMPVVADGSTCRQGWSGLFAYRTTHSEGAAGPKSVGLQAGSRPACTITSKCKVLWACSFAEAIGAGRISKVEKIDNCCVLAAVRASLSGSLGAACPASPCKSS